MLVTLARRRHAIRFVVFQDADAQSGGLSDRPAFARLAALLTAEGVVAELVRPAADPDSIAATFRGTVLHCGTRFHGCVLAALLGVPTVGIATDPKVSSLCSELSLPHMTPEEVSVERLLAAAEDQIGCTLSPARLADLRRRSELNFAWFAGHSQPAQLT